jgi:thiamine-monophosphate kinase
VRENDLIRYVRERTANSRAKNKSNSLVGIGDDCCVWQPQGPTCLSTDTIVEGRHFRADHAPHDIGYKAAAAALSDIAAMGACPIGAVVALTCPSRWDGRAVMEGVLALLDAYDCPLVGGDTTGGEELTLTVTVWGEAAPTAHGPGRFLYRHGGQVGDLLVVTGPLGGSLINNRHLRPVPRIAEGQWLAACPYVHALMDLSDGLAADAPKLAEASGLGCLLLPAQIPIHDDVPVMSDRIKSAMCDGEDYELLCAVAPEHWPAMQLAWPFAERLTTVGWLIEQPGAYMENANGRIVPLPWTGFEHAG